MFSIILIAVWASVNAATWDDTPLQQHFDRIESVGFNSLAMGKQRNELEPRGGTPKVWYKQRCETGTHYGDYPSVAKAKDACLDDMNCKYVENVKECKGNKASLCPISATLARAKGGSFRKADTQSCVHQKGVCNNNGAQDNGETGVDCSGGSNSWNTGCPFCIEDTFKFKHKGHCAEGYVKPNTKEGSLLACRNKCAKIWNVGYFAYSTSKQCACYLESKLCPDDENYDDHDAYRILREVEEYVDDSATYHRLSRFGLCGISGSSFKPENCQISDDMVGNIENTCQSYCSTDSSCKGFDFKSGKNGNGCTVYTTSTCRAEYNKVSRGYTGDLIQDTIYLAGNHHYSGCFKKMSDARCKDKLDAATCKNFVVFLGLCDLGTNGVGWLCVSSCGLQSDCLEKILALETCNDGIQNQDETGNDCGGVCTSCDWIGRTLVSDEGYEIAGVNSGKTLEECKIWCDHTDDCNSIAWQPAGACYLKQKCLNEGMDSKVVGEFKSYFKPCRGSE